MSRDNEKQIHQIIPLHEVSDAAIPLDAPVRGIYFLMEYGEVVYVGQSQDCRARIQQHIRAKEFDAYAIFEVPDNIDLDAMEAEHIAYYVPRDNRQMPMASGYIGITQIRRMGLTKWDLNRWAKSGLVTPVYMGNGIFYREEAIRAAQESESQ